jgi:ureidoacrylate peracid hydrolase
VSAQGYALVVVDMQNGFCHPEGSFPGIGLGLEGVAPAVRTAAIAVNRPARQASQSSSPVTCTG